MAAFDYVIVGGGSAGCVIANRLVAVRCLGLCARGGAGGSQSVHPDAGRLREDAVQSRHHLAVPDRAFGMDRGTTHLHHAGPHAGRVQLDQWHGLRARSGGRLQCVGAARQSRLELRGPAALFPAHRAAHRRRRGPRVSRTRWAAAGHRSGLDAPAVRRVHRGRPNGRLSTRPRLQRRLSGRRRLLPARDPPDAARSAPRAPICAR